MSQVCQEFSRINHMYAYTYGQFYNFGQVRIFHKHDGNRCERHVRICHTCVNFTGVTNTLISVTCVKIALLSFHRGYLIFSHLVFIRWNKIRSYTSIFKFWCSWMELNSILHWMLFRLFHVIRIQRHLKQRGRDSHQSHSLDKSIILHCHSKQVMMSPI